MKNMTENKLAEALITQAEVIKEMHEIQNSICRKSQIICNTKYKNEYEMLLRERTDIFLVAVNERLNIGT